MVQTQNTLAINIPGGAPEGFEEVFHGEADESPDYDAGDVIVRVRSRRESSKEWTRKEAGLVGRVTLSVAEVSTRRLWQRFPAPPFKRRGILISRMTVHYNEAMGH